MARHTGLDRLPTHPAGKRPNELVRAYFLYQDDLRRFIAARYGEHRADDLMQRLYVQIAGLGAITVIHGAPAYLYRLALNLSHGEATHDEFRVKELVRAVGRLPSKARTVFYLSKLEGHSLAQSADHLRLPRRTVERRLRAALSGLLVKVGRP